MVKFRNGDMFSEATLENIRVRYPGYDLSHPKIRDDVVLLATSNAYINKWGDLVMGRGAAQQMRDMFPGAARTFGSILDKGDPRYRGPQVAYQTYGILIDVNIQLGVFQVKYHFRNKADLNLIRYSTGELRTLAGRWRANKFWLNFPGIGYGELQEEEVLPIIEHLPDNVTIWKKSNV